MVMQNHWPSYRGQRRSRGFVFCFFWWCEYFFMAVKIISRMQPWESYLAVLNWIFTLLKSKRRRNWNSRTFLDCQGTGQIFQLCGCEWQMSGRGHLPWAYRDAAVPRTTAQTPERHKPRWHFSESGTTFALDIERLFGCGFFFFLRETFSGESKNLLKAGAGRKSMKSGSPSARQP